MTDRVAKLIAAFFLIVASLFLTAPSFAQSTRSQLFQSYLNPCIVANSQGLITQSCAYNLFSQIIGSTGNLADTNTWTGANTFSGATRAVTQSLGDNTTFVATDAFVHNAIASLLPSPVANSLFGWNGSSVPSVFTPGANGVVYGNGAGALTVGPLPLANIANITPGVLGYAGGGTGAISSLTTLPSALTIPSPTISGNLSVTAIGLTTGQQFYGSGTPSSNKLATYAYGTVNTPVVSLPTNAGAAVTGASWTSLGGGTTNAFGGIDWAFVDAANSLSGWVWYGECDKYSGSTGTCQAELDQGNFTGSTVDINPANPFAAGATLGWHIAAGGGWSITNASFTATISNGSGGSGVILNVSAVASGTIKANAQIIGSGVTAGSTVLPFGTGGTTGTGSTGTYQLSLASSVLVGESMTNASLAYDPATGLHDLTPVASSAAWLVSSNPVTFNKGWVFDQKALTGADGTDSGGTTAIAGAMGRGQGLYWYDSNGRQTTGVFSSLKTTDPAMNLGFVTGSGLVYSNANGKMFQVFPGTLASPLAEGVAIVPGAGGGNNPPTIEPTTTDSQTVLGLILTTIGSGKVGVTNSSFGLSGAISAPAWTTAGIRYANVAATLTDTTSSGTVVLAYSSLFGGETIAATNASTIYTNYVSSYFKNPVAGTNVTLTQKWALGADGIYLPAATNAVAIFGTNGNFAMRCYSANSGTTGYICEGVTDSQGGFDPLTISGSVVNLAFHGTVEVAVNSTTVTLSSGVGMTFTTLPSGTPSTYACFTTGGALVSSAAPC